MKGLNLFSEFFTRDSINIILSLFKDDPLASCTIVFLVVLITSLLWSVNPQ